MSEAINEKCAVFGVYGKDLDVSRIAYFALFSMQHRGQESSGIATSDGLRLLSYRNVGLVAQAYTEGILRKLSGHIAIGHNRYSTSRGTGLLHAQPVMVDPELARGWGSGTAGTDAFLALAHNGNLPTTEALTAFLSERSVAVQGLSDSELMAEAVKWYMRTGLDAKGAVAASWPLFTGAFSFLILTRDALIAARDACGIRPLSIGRLNGGYVIASETCAFKTIGAKFIRDIEPGELVAITERGIESLRVAPPNLKLDVFEFIYFARHDSVIEGRSVYEVRKRFGERLAAEAPLEADIVVPVPETAIPAAIGYSHASGIPFEMALAKNRYIQRTFIEPDQRSRDLGVKLKLTPIPEVLNGKRVVLMDDSIVRGTTSRQIVRTLFEAGAREVHFLVSSPPVKYPDFYGIDISLQRDLIAAQKTLEEIREFLGATSLHYLSLDGLIASIGMPREELCTSCFTGEYPIDLGERWEEIILPPGMKYVCE